MISRRQFLQASATLSAAPLAYGVAPVIRSVTSPAPGDAHFFVTLWHYGGMDVTLGLDPWLGSELPNPTDMFVEYRPEEVIHATEFLKLGPAAAPLLPHAKDIAVVNGLFMSRTNFDHVANGAYVSSASSSEMAPSLAAELAVTSAQGEGHFGILGNNGVRTGFRTVANSMLTDLKALPQRRDLTDLLSALFNGTAQMTPYLDSILRVINGKQLMGTFANNLAKFKPLETITDFQVMAAAFLSEAAYSAELNVFDLALDTHSGHLENHLREQTKGWENVHQLFTLFKNTPYGSRGESLFDRTTFLIVNEFARTPFLNSAQGKDHNPLTNSVLLAGRGIRGGQTIGASRLVTADNSADGIPYHIAYPIDFRSGEVLYERTVEAKMIFPENIGRTIAQLMDVDWSLVQSFPQSTQVLTRLLK